MTVLSDFYRGDTRKYKIIIRDKVTQVPISVDGGTLTFTLKKDKSAADDKAIIQKSVLATDDPNNPTGTILLVLSSADTNVDPGQYFYDFQYVSESGEVTTILPQIGDVGRIQIITDITRTTS